MSFRITVRLTPEPAEWLNEKSYPTGLPPARVVQTQLEPARRFRQAGVLAPRRKDDRAA
jgi:hypothetical protein